MLLIKDRKSGIWLSNRKPVLFRWQPVFNFFPCFRHGNYIKITKCQIKLIHTVSVWKSFHQTVKYGRQRNLLLQDLTGLEI